MKINFFNKKIEINIKSDEDNIISKKKKIFYEKYKSRSLILLISFIILSILCIYKKNSNEYRIGSIAKNDIIAYKNLTYEKDILDEDLQNKILKNTEPEYDRKEEVSQIQIKKFSDFLENLSKIDLKDDAEIKNFLKENSVNIKYTDAKKIGIKSGVNYYVFLVDVLSKIYRQGVVNKNDLNTILSKNQIVLEDFEKELIKQFVEPNLFINEQKTKNKISENIKSLKNNTFVINKGDLLVKKGDKITISMYEQLEKLALVKGSSKTIRSFFTVLFNVGLAIIVYLGIKKYFKNGIESKGFYPSYITFIFISILNVFFYNTSSIVYLIPFATVSIISSVLTKNKIFSLIISLLTNILIAPNFEWFIVMCLISLIAIADNEKMSARLDLVKNGIKLGVYQAVFVLIYSLIYNYDFKFTTTIIFLSIISGFLTSMLCLALMPYFENTFSILTDIKLLELGDYSSKLMKRLLLEAPGTFYHSIMVGALAEQAAEAIGANPILARVGAYYHDIGKLKRPLYFVENQSGMENLHDELKPSLSSLILTSHTKDGYILGKQYGLPDEVLNIIVEHHGTTMVQFFYYKAVEIGEKINETDFRYVGPKPSSKEAAIVMLADTVEAAVRASKDKSKDGIENTIRYLIKYKIDDNQLNNCDIALKDIDLIVEAFIKVLKAAYHERIQYPSINQKK